MNTRPTTRLTQPILWIATVALLLLAFGNRMQLTTCVGDCCAVEVASCCRDAATDEVTHDCCGCCERDGGESDGDDPDSTGGTCDSGCCVTLAVDVELAPATTPAELPDHQPLAFEPARPKFVASQPRAEVRTRPFDRGPPRIDRRTAMRACVVLLI